jgi:hypothetical protein
MFSTRHLSVSLRPHVPRNLSRAVCKISIPNLIVNQETFLESVGDYQLFLDFPPSDNSGPSCTLLPSAVVTKDARGTIATTISSRLVFADTFVNKNDEKSEALLAYSVLSEIVRFSHGDLLRHHHKSGKIKEQYQCIKS